MVSAYTYGGHSGGAVYRCCIGSDYIFQGVNSTSNRMGTREATLFTPQMNLDLIQHHQQQMLAQRPPVDRAQLIEYVFDNYSKGLGVLSVAVGDLFDLVLNAFNAGYAPSGAVTADIYLTKTYDVFEGTYVGLVSLGTIWTRINTPSSTRHCAFRPTYHLAITSLDGLCTGQPLSTTPTTTRPSLPKDSFA